MSVAQGGVTFTYFCSLLREIAKIHPRKWSNRHTLDTHPALDIFKRWLDSLRIHFSPLPTHTVAICLRFLFPEEDIRRKYEIQEARLIKHLTESLGLNKDALKGWSDEESVGCLGEEVKKALERTCPHPDGFISSVTIAQIDKLLDELASISKFSHTSIQESHSGGVRRQRAEIISSLFRKLSPMDAGFLTQIILKDLRPILYSISELHYSTALKDFKSNAINMLTKEDVMRAWDPTGWMLRYYRVRCDVVDAADAFELPDHQRPNISPVFGKQVELPKAKKGHDSIHALHFLRDSRTVWAETKYDGERAQIHVEVVCNDPPKITIFSKSKRDSTWERRAVHSTILEALGFPLDNPQLQARSSKVAIQNIILDAEMVAFKGVKVDEFWRIRPLIGRAAYGVQDSKQLISRRLPGTELCSDIPENRRLGLVFFDILMLNSVSLLQTPYSHRREMLESLIKQVPGKAILSARYPINMKGFQPSNELRRIFAQHIADHEEGLILKAEESQYNDYNFPWVKFKKDYIEGYGDCIDLVVIGAGWDKERGRELRVPPSTYTTFYIGALANSGQRIQNPIILPHFFVYFTVSYGLTRDQLEEVNFLIKSSDRVLYDPSMMNNQMPYTFTVFSGISSPPRVVLRVPLLAELFGAGFTKSANCMHYELRFPRITKIHRKQERTWEDAIRLDELNSIAMESAGVKKPENDIDEWAGDLFGKSSVPGTSTPRKREATKDYWSKRLFSLDHAAAGKRGIILLHAQDKGGLVASENAVSASETFSSSNSQSSAPGANNVIGGLCLGTTSAALTSAGSSHNARTIFKPSEPDTMMLEDISNFTHMTVVAPRPSRSVFKSMSSRKVAFLKDKLISFVGYSGRCLHCKKLKRSVSVTRRVHCVASLLSGCDWVAEKNGMNSSWIGGGIIVVGDHDKAGEDIKAYMLEKMQGTWKNVRDKTTGRPIWIVGCRGEEYSRVDV